MAATFKWFQYNGADAGTATDLGSGGNNAFNFKNYDSATPADYSTYPITAGNNSYEVWLKGDWSGTFNKIDNLQFWRSTDFSPNTGLAIDWKGNNQTTGVTPVATESTVATVAVPTADPGTANVSIGGSLSGNLTAAGKSDFIVLQLQTTTDAAAGDTSLATFTLQYDEQ
jgi:hypothetical protein